MLQKKQWVSKPSTGFAPCVNQHHLLVNHFHDTKDILHVQAVHRPAGHRFGSDQARKTLTLQVQLNPICQLTLSLNERINTNLIYEKKSNYKQIFAINSSTVSLHLSQEKAMSFSSWWWPTQKWELEANKESESYSPTTEFTQIKLKTEVFKSIFTLTHSLHFPLKMITKTTKKTKQ